MVLLSASATHRLMFGMSAVPVLVLETTAVPLLLVSVPAGHAPSISTLAAPGVSPVMSAILATDCKKSKSVIRAEQRAKQAEHRVCATSLALPACVFLDLVLGSGFEQDLTSVEPHTSVDTRRGIYTRYNIRGGE